MTEQEIKESNKLIAEFMGARIEEKDNYFYAYDWKDNSELVDGVPIDYLETKEESKNIMECSLLNLYTGDWGRFHSDWNWLTSVIEKITHIDMGVPRMRRIYFNTFRCRKNHPTEHTYKVRIHTDFKDFLLKTESNSEIEATWLAVIQFIKWYNSCKNN